MKKYFLILLTSCVFKLGFGQFDRINSDPIGLHPSFAGSTGKQRLALHHNTSPFTSNYSTLTYDALIPELKGGIAVSLASIYNLPDEPKFTTNTGKIAYAPKFTFDNEVTWSPSISVELGRSTYAGTDFFQGGQSTYKSGSLGIMRNTKKNYFGLEVRSRESAYSFEDQFFFGSTEIIGVFGQKFDRDETNGLSSTLMTKVGFMLHFDSNYNIARSLLARISYLNLEYTLRYNKFIASIDLLGAGIGYKSDRFAIDFRTGAYYGELSTFQINATLNLK